MGEAKRRRKSDPNWGKLKTYNQRKKQTARKILIVSGSTYNTSTPEKIKQALRETEFLDDWAVIIAIHKYLRLDDTRLTLNEFLNKINLEWSFSSSNFSVELNLIPITKAEHIPIEIGNIYVLPHSLSEPIIFKKGNSNNFIIEIGENNKYLETCLIDDENKLNIYAKGSTISEEFTQWFLNNEFDASYVKRIVTANDLFHLASERLPSGIEKLDQDLICFIKNLRPETVIYQDMPCIDQTMNQIAASKNLDKIAALLLCGLHGDGAYGLKEIKDKGGYTAVQLPDECDNPQVKGTCSIPNAALRIEPNHQKVTLEDKPNCQKLSDWLTSIK